MTPRQNALVEIGTIFEVSGQLIVNAASLRLKEPAVSRTITGLRQAIEAAANERPARKSAS